ncbi:MAG TPA: aromatic-ring-hydroxylating dioxygenase subunit beta [Rhizomicrobium sp.]|jgi:anthranilate 1,2-dioxygenase small subunit
MKDVDVNASLITRLRVGAFLADYVHALDSDRLEEWPDFFVEDANYQVITRENAERGLPLSIMLCQGRGMFRDRISALRTANIFEPHVYCHIPGALRVLDDAHGAIQTESTFSVIRTMADGAMSLFACGRSRDRFVDGPGGLKLAERIVILDSRQVDTLLVIPL